MFQRKPERKQLHGVDTNSAFFTTHAPPSSNGNGPKSPIEVGYASNQGLGPPPMPGRSSFTSAGSSGGRRYSSGGNRARGRNSFGGAICCLLIFVVWTCIILGAGYYYNETIWLPQQQQQNQQELDNKISHWKSKVTKLENSLSLITKEKTALENQQRAHQDDQNQLAGQIVQLQNDVEHAKTNSQELQRQLEEAQQSTNNNGGGYGTVQEMQSVIQSISRRSLVEKFGNGPYRIEVELNFPQDNNVEQSWYFTIELATKEEMPHSVYSFLEQMTRGLYNDGGYSFYTNGSHIVAGGPYPNHLTSSERWDRIADFKNSNWGKLAEFPEYSSQYPHEKFTVGLSLGMSNSAGAPIIYINMIDNSEHHGPGGNGGNSPDPCFGRITHGFDVVERMHNSSPGGVPPPPGEWKDMEHGPIAVKSIKIL